MTDEGVEKASAYVTRNALMSEVKALKEENARLRVLGVCAVEGGAPTEAIESPLPATASWSVGSDDFVAFYRELMVALVTHDPSALAPDALPSKKYAAVMAFVAFKDLCRDHEMLVAQVRKNTESQAERERQQTAEEHAARLKKAQNRLAVRAGPVRVVQTTGRPDLPSKIPSGLSAEDMEMLREAEAQGVGPRSVESD